MKSAPATPAAGGPPSLVVTIDGPAGSGKSSTAKAVAARLGVRHLDSGALYRALTHALLERGEGPESWDDLEQGALAGVEIALRPTERGFDVLLGGRRLDAELRTREVTSAVSQAARVPAVRARLIDLQRSAGEHGGLVADGRDMGTVVFPEAPLMVFLVADLPERARRRFLEREGRAPDQAETDEEAARLAARDAIDEGREAAPLRRARGALVVDTTALTMTEQVDRIVRAAQEVIPTAGS